MKTGRGYKKITNSMISEFVNNYRFRKSPEFVPQTMAGLGTTRLNPKTYQIYPRTLGMIPTYAGHVPGRLYICGETYGNSTVNAKQHLWQPLF